MLANLTSNERINRRRYPWLNASPGGPPFNRYDLGAWDNLMEFWGIGVGVEGSGGGGGGGGEKVGGCGVGAKDPGAGRDRCRCRRRPRDYLKVRGRPNAEAEEGRVFGSVLPCSFFAPRPP